MGYPIKKLGDNTIFKIKGSGINIFDGEKKYYSTSSIQLNKVLEPESIITYKNRQSRANMEFEKGTVIFAKMKDTNKVIIIDDNLSNNAIFSTGFSGIRGKDTDVFPGYLFYYFTSSYFNKIKDELSSGVTQVAINNSGISKIPIPLPSLPTQKLIVQKLDSAFENIDKNINLTKENLKNLEELNKSVLEKVFSDGEYEMKLFGDIVYNLDGKRRPVKASDRKTEHGTYPYYGASGIIDYVDNYTHEGENLLISEDGANLVARKYPIAFIAEGKYWVNNHAHIVKAKEGVSDNYYLKYFFANKDISSYVTGSAQPKFNQKNLNSIQVPIPPLQKQKEIVIYLDEVFEKNKELKMKYDEQLKELEELKQSLLKEAFEGRLVKE